jgi:hypothetical protein
MFWFPAYLILRDLPKPIPVGTGESFTAPDPWNGGKPTQFSVEFYKIVPNGWSRQYAVRMAKLHGVDLFHIRSSPGGLSRRLPDSLSDLWRSKQVATEALPRLLYELEPSLRKYDYFRILHHRRFEWGGALYALFCFGLMLFFLIVVPGDTPGYARAFGTIGFGLLGSAIILQSVLLPRRWRQRCRRQMEWILANSPLQIDDAN